MIVGQIFLKPNIRITLPTTDTKWDSIIENNNRWKDLYISVYNFHNDPKGYNAIVDKIFLDFDPIGNDDEISYTNCQTVVQYLRSENVAHNVLYSGRGFHILIDLDTSIILNNPKQAIRNYVTELHQETNTLSDNSVVGDLMRVRRCPNTINLKTGRYCIPLFSDEIIKLTLQEIKSLATSTRNIHPTSFLNKLNLKKYDIDKPNIYQSVQKSDEIIFSKNYIPCIRKMMLDDSLGYQRRGYIITFLRDMGYSIDDTHTIMKNFLTEEKYQHCADSEHQIEYLYDRTDVLFPNCRRLEDEGICCDKNCKGNYLYI
jgi:hypothetical protein